MLRHLDKVGIAILLSLLAGCSTYRAIDVDQVLSDVAGEAACASLLNLEPVKPQPAPAPVRVDEAPKPAPPTKAPAVPVKPAAKPAVRYEVQPTYYNYGSGRFFRR